MSYPYPPGSTGASDSNRLAGTPGLISRRSSYASVLSGTARPNNSHQTPPSTMSHLLSQGMDSTYAPGYNQFVRSPALYDNRGSDGNTQRHGSVASGGITQLRQAQLLPSWSRAYNGIAGGNSSDGLVAGADDDFLTPSYLRDSKYVQDLHDTYEKRAAASLDSLSVSTTHLGGLPTNASTTNLNGKAAASHRGMTYDLIEKAPPLNDGGLAPLPSRWNSHDKNTSLDVVSGDGLEVKYTGTRSSSDRDLDASSIRSDHPIPPQCGLYYFEVTILSRNKETSIGVGFSSKDVSLNRPPGWERESWAYHGDDGNSYCCQNNGKSYGPPFSSGDIIGCGINFRTGNAFFTKNGKHQGIAFREIRGKVYPSIGMKKSGEHIRVNFGQDHFVYDIDSMMMREKQTVMKDVGNTSTSKLVAGMDENSLIQALVLQYLSHDGYVETAKSFAEEVREEREALHIDSRTSIQPLNFVQEDDEAMNRQKIRAAILDGDVDKALKHTYAYYPNVLEENQHIYFRLRNQKFIEMVRRFSEIRNNSVDSLKKSNGHGHVWQDDGGNQAMDVDEIAPSNGFGRLDDTIGVNSSSDYEHLVQQAIQYGQDLQAEFANDPSREVQEQLQASWSLICYEDPINERAVAHLLNREARNSVAEELNSAMLASVGKSPYAALATILQQTTVLINDLRETGGPGAFINIGEYMKSETGHTN